MSTVRVCSLYGAGFYYIPGTDTCIKIGGYLRADVTFDGGGAHGVPAWNGDAGERNPRPGDSRPRDSLFAKCDSRGSFNAKRNPFAIFRGTLYCPWWNESPDL